MADPRLAIVIPAYKGRFLHDTLSSFVNQTCKDFILYIGDDASPDNLPEVVRQFETRINLRYHRFKENLGKKDLVAQWERCIDLVKTQQWIWLFSDDDVADPECVEAFFSFIREHKEASLVRFNTRIIDRNANVVAENPVYPDVLTGLQYLKARYKYQLMSNAVEYIFRKDLLRELGGFVNFPLGWCADDATWTKLGQRVGIMTIGGPKVGWRSSGLNISTWNDKETADLKFRSCMDFFCWTREFLIARGEPLKKWQRILAKWLFSKAYKQDGGLKLRNVISVIHVLDEKRALYPGGKAGWLLTGLEMKYKLGSKKRWLKFRKRSTIAG